MKKIYLIICLSLLYSPCKTLAQSLNDKNQILQQCVSLEQLNKKIPEKGKPIKIFPNCYKSTSSVPSLPTFSTYKTCFLSLPGDKFDLVS